MSAQPIGTAAAAPAAQAWSNPHRLLPFLRLLLVLAAVVVAAPASREDRSTGPVVLASGWQFRLDPGEVGLVQHWQDPSVGFPAQRSASTGVSLADQGIPEYRGYSWFRRTVTVPAGWRRILLGFGGVDVACQVYVNGVLAGEFRDSDLGDRAALIDLTGRVRPGQSFTLVLRVLGTGGFGGIKQTVRLGDDESEVMTSQQYGLFLHQQHPDWLLLPWMAGQRRAWTVVGNENANARAVAGADGSFSPWSGSYSVSFWLYDVAAQRLVPFQLPAASLAGSSPLPIFTFENGPWQLREELVPAGNAQHPAVEARLTLLAAPGAAQLYVAVRPYATSGDMYPMRQVNFRGSSVWVNGALALSMSGVEGARGGALASGDASSFAAAGTLPAASSVEDSRGAAQALLRIPLTIGSALTILAPSAPTTQAAPDAVDPQRQAATWQQRTQHVQLDLPDQRLRRAFYASLGYILTLTDDGQIRPGPLLHNAFWVRDASVIGYALERAGLRDAVAGSSEALLHAIDSGGSVTAITDAGGQPRPDVEWDAPGEA
ncbi:MAG TPA: hypothetical protein VKU60_15455, partial [Chloroflexota bacterium]|nr:hypothetical protein [Chloroflexota bacterium]